MFIAHYQYSTYQYSLKYTFLSSLCTLYRKPGVYKTKCSLFISKWGRCLKLYILVDLIQLNRSTCSSIAPQRIGGLPFRLMALSMWQTFHSQDHNSHSGSWLLIHTRNETFRFRAGCLIYTQLCMHSQDIGGYSDCSHCHLSLSNSTTINITLLFLSTLKSTCLTRMIWTQSPLLRKQ